MSSTVIVFVAAVNVSDGDGDLFCKQSTLNSAINSSKLRLCDLIKYAI